MIIHFPAYHWIASDRLENEAPWAFQMSCLRLYWWPEFAEAYGYWILKFLHETNAEIRWT